MQDDLQNLNIFVGIKQSTEAVTEGRALKAYIAEDADSHVKEPFILLCKENLVPVERIPTKEQLGKACGITVSAACCVILT